MMPVDRSQHGRLRNVIATVAVATVVAGGASLITNVIAPGGGGGGTGANLYVDTSTADNGCIRLATPGSYDSTRACSSFQAAYAAAASSGDTICVEPGSYSAQPITFVAGHTTPATVFQGCDGAQPVVLAVNIGNGGSGNQPRAITFKDMAITGGPSNTAITSQYGGTTLANAPTDITFDNIDIAVGKASPGRAVEIIGGTERLTIKNSRIGPICCGQDFNGGSPEAIRLGTWDRVSLGYPVSTDTVIDNNTIKGITRLCSEWLTGYGACPATTCPNVNDQCHEDAIHIYGATNLTITNNRIYHTGINGIFLDSTDPETNGTIANNMIGDIMRGATCFDIDGREIHGTWNIINNTCSIAGGDGYYVGNALVMDANNAVWNWKGNIGAIFISAVTTPEGSGGDCQAGSVGVFTYSYNTVSTDNGAATNCGGNTTVGDPAYANTALAPADTMDLHLAGAETGPADNKIPPALCSGFVTTDIDRDGRPLAPDTNCDAGADER